MAYYTPSGLPANQTREISAQIRNEYALLAAGFNMLPLPAFLWGGAANFATDTGAANAYVVTNGSAYVTGYYDGLTLNIRALAANTGASTLNLNGLGLKAIVRADGTALQAGDILAGQPFSVIYNNAAGNFTIGITSGIAVNALASATAASASASAASLSAAAAAASEAAAALSAAQASTITANGAPLWVSGTTYTQGYGVYSPLSFQTYRLSVASLLSTVDPSIDTTNWTALGGGSVPDFLLYAQGII